MLHRLAKKAKRLLTGSPFPGSKQYWIERYEAGRTSGAGSYNELAEFKAEIINAFVVEHGIDSVMEFGCGDGNQLRLASYPSYTGFDANPRAVELCRDIFASYMETLFAAAERFVILYSSNSEHREPDQARHVRHRNFTRWVDANMADWVLIEYLANRHPQSAPDAQGSLADFYFYQKRSGG